MRNRVTLRPAPADWSDDDLMSLAEVIAVFWPNGPLTVTALRTEIRHGRLIEERIAGKIFVTPAALEEMRKRCRAQPGHRVSSSASETVALRSTSSSTKAMKQAQTEALAKNEALRKRLKADRS